MATIEDRERLAADMLGADYVATQRDRYLTFWVGGREYGVALGTVLEIRGLEPQPEPAVARCAAPDMVDLRGTMVPAVDLRRCFSCEPVRGQGPESLVFVQVNGAVAGLVVDSVGEVVEIPGDLISVPAAATSSGTGDFLSGERRLGESITAILDLEQLLPAWTRAQ